MKSPDEIKKGLECDDCKSCPYGDRNNNDGDNHCDEVEGDALALIQQLQAENTEKDARIKQLEAERNAAVADLKKGGNCFACKNWKTEVCFACQYGRTRRFEWRGLQKKETP